MVTGRIGRTGYHEGLAGEGVVLSIKAHAPGTSFTLIWACYTDTHHPSERILTTQMILSLFI